MISIRPATDADIDVFLGLVDALADYERANLTPARV